MNAAKLSLLLLLLLVSADPAHAEASERYPETRTRLLQPEDIHSWNDAKLRYAINEMYARHGADFKDQKIKEWFLRFTWYHPRRGLTYDEAEAEFTDLEKQNVKLLGEARDRSEPQTHSSTTGASSGAVKRAIIIDVPPEYADAPFKVGNVKVIFADGHAEVLTKDDSCLDPQVSRSGLVGWIYFSGEDDLGYLQNSAVVVHFPDGSIKRFTPDAGAPFIDRWAFVEQDSSIVIKSGTHHSFVGFIRYHLKTGKVTGHFEGADERMPEWVRPFAD